MARWTDTDVELALVRAGFTPTVATRKWTHSYAKLTKDIDEAAGWAVARYHNQREERRRARNHGTGYIPD